MPSRKNKGKGKAKKVAFAPRTATHERLDLGVFNPNISVTDTPYEQLAGLNIANDPPDEDFGRPPFYVKFMWIDFPKEGLAPIAGYEDGGGEYYFGPYNCAQEASDAAILIAVDKFRQFNKDYYGILEDKPPMRIVPNTEDGDVMHVDPTDTRGRFWLATTANNTKPDLETDNLYEYPVMTQGWDVFVITCLTFGGSRERWIPTNYPVIKKKVSVNLNNANKFAVAFFLNATNGLLPEYRQLEFMEDIKEASRQAEVKMHEEIELADDSTGSYSWGYRKKFISQHKLKDLKGNMKHPESWIEITVEKFDSDP